MKKSIAGLMIGLFWTGSVLAENQVKISNFGTVATVNGVAISSTLFERNFEEYMRDNNINVG